MTNTLFFPKNRTFWLYHGGSVLFVLAITLVSSYLYGAWGPRSWADSIAWILPYTLVVLGFRTLYRKLAWNQLAMSRLIPVVVLYGTISGAVIASLTTAMVTPFFWDSIVASQLTREPQVTASLYFVRQIVGGALQNQLFVCAWAFIYISVTGNRRIKETELINLRLKNSLKEAQLSSLSNQLNPHFLFNALNNIRFMIHENAKQADAMVIALSEILRYSLASSEHEKVSLRQEIAVIHQYIAIMRIQMELRLQFEMAIPPTLHQFQLPPMVLQMLVENAIKHGLEHLPRGGALRVLASENEQQLILQVINDVSDKTEMSYGGMGIGLKNIQQRLRLLYGDHAGLSIARDERHFTATMHLPLEAAI